MVGGSQTKVVLYHAKTCHLCERARGIVAEIRLQIPFELQEVEIDGDPELEERYRSGFRYSRSMASGPSSTTWIQMPFAANWAHKVDLRAPLASRDTTGSGCHKLSNPGARWRCLIG